jgi:hypothetical protein
MLDPGMEILLFIPIIKHSISSSRLTSTPSAFVILS